MNFKHQIITTCIIGFLLGGASSFNWAEGLTQAYLPDEDIVLEKPYSSKITM